MPNQHGLNGRALQAAPPDEELKSKLFDWQQLGYRISEQLVMLEQDYNYKISESTFRRLRNRLQVRTSRYTRNMADDQLTSSLQEIIGIGGENPFRDEEGDETLGMGVRRARDHLAVEKGLIVSHRLVRQKLQELDPLGVQRRWPGAHRPYRAVLQSAGWADEWAADGHEKLAERGLGLGPTVSFEIYGIRDKYTGAFVILKCVPNARDRATVGHVYLDAVESEGGCPRKMVVDCGTETNDALQAQIAFRSYFAPELDTTDYPPFARIRSVHNTVIEGAWSKFARLEGMTLRRIIKSRADEVDLDDEVTIMLFRWIWSQVIQLRLDAYVRVHNSSRVRYQPRKKMPSGHRPIRAKRGETGGEDCLIPVLPEAIASVRLKLEPALQFVEEEYMEKFSELHQELGLPSLSRGTGWRVFFAMLEALSE